MDEVTRATVCVCDLAVSEKALAWRNTYKYMDYHGIVSHTHTSNADIKHTHADITHKC